MANGDITPQTPRQDTKLTLHEIQIVVGGPNPHAIFRWRDGFDRMYEATIRNGISTGFNYATGASVSVSTPTGLTDVRADLTLTNAKITNAVTTIKAAILSVTGTVE